jgi:hypothetical protein
MGAVVANPVGTEFLAIATLVHRDIHRQMSEAA